MKLLVDCTSLTVGGGIQVAIAFLAGLRSSNAADWVAVAPELMKAAIPVELAADARVTFVKKRSIIDRIFIARQLRSIEREVQPDVVFTIFGPQMFRARAPHLVGFAQPHMIYDPEPDLIVTTSIGDWLRRVMLRRADHIVVETETARRRFAERVGFAIDRVHVVPNAINPFLRDLPDAPPPSGSPFIVFMPSAWYAHKKLGLAPYVAKAMKDLAPELDVRFRLTLPPDGEPWRNIARLAVQCGVEDRVVTMGAVPVVELSQAYHEASAIYLPTVREVSTAVYPESFFFRRPLVTTDIDFARELCRDAALFTQPGDVHAAAHALIALARDEELRLRLTRAGQAQLARVYPTAERKFQMQIELLSKVAASRSNHADP